MLPAFLLFMSNVDNTDVVYYLDGVAAAKPSAGRGLQLRLTHKMCS